MGNVAFLFRIDIGFDPERGYAATLLDVQLNRQKGVRGNSPQQLISRIRNVFLEEVLHKRDFPLEAEKSRIITPIDFGNGEQ